MPLTFFLLVGSKRFTEGYLPIFLAAFCLLSPHRNIAPRWGLRTCPLSTPRSWRYSRRIASNYIGLREPFDENTALFLDRYLRLKRLNPLSFGRESRRWKLSQFPSAALRGVQNLSMLTADKKGDTRSCTVATSSLLPIRRKTISLCRSG